MPPRPKLYACRKCGLVYDAPVNNGRCLSVSGTSSLDYRTLTRCGGDIKPLGWKPLVKDERQLDIEQAIQD